MKKLFSLCAALIICISAFAQQPKYDEYFTQKYGQWRDDLEQDQKKSHHDLLAYDLSTSYVDYIKNIK